MSDEKKHQQCPNCNSFNTELEVDKSFDGEEETLHLSVWCLNCMTYSPFDIDENWSQYV